MPSKPEVIAEKRRTDPEFLERQRGYARKFRERNLEKERERQRIEKQNSRESNREAYNAYMRDYISNNKDTINAERRNRRLNDFDFAERQRLLERIHYANNKKAHKNVRLKSVYGITIQEYEEMYHAQNGCCSICGIHKPDSGRGGLQVDHCHDTGIVRGLLCTACNTGIGKLKDNVDVLLSAINYILKYRKE